MSSEANPVTSVPPFPSSPPPPGSSVCPKCGAAISPEAPQGICPRCVFARAAQATEPGPRPLREAPTLAAVAAAFPQLELQEFIGQGGMGCVYRARQPHLDRVIALKLLPQGLAADPAFVERFTREARLLARLNHPNIVTVYDFGQAGGFCFLLMEYVEGANLRQVLQTGQFTANQALAIVPRICDALQYAHGEGVLHRDIKPENILLDSKGRIKLADFGVAKLVGDAETDFTLTATGAPLGTPHYMAPEQVEAPSDVDHRADIYSLGVVFYEMLTGGLPLGRFPAPSHTAPMDPRLDDVVFQALEKQKERRQQDANEVRTQVEGIATQPGTLSSGQLPPRPGAVAHSAPGPGPGPRQGPTGTQPAPPSVVAPATPEAPKRWWRRVFQGSHWGIAAAAVAFGTAFLVTLMPALKPAFWAAPGAFEIIALTGVLAFPATFIGFLIFRSALRQGLTARWWEASLFATLAWPIAVIGALGGLVIVAAHSFPPALAAAILLGMVFVRLPGWLGRLPMFRELGQGIGGNYDLGRSLLRFIPWGIGLMLVPAILIHVFLRGLSRPATAYDPPISEGYTVGIDPNTQPQLPQRPPTSEEFVPAHPPGPPMPAESGQPANVGNQGATALVVEPAQGESVHVLVNFHSNGIPHQLAAFNSRVDLPPPGMTIPQLKYELDPSLVPGTMRLRFFRTDAPKMTVSETWLRLPPERTLTTTFQAGRLSFPPGVATNYWLFQFGPEPNRWGIEAVLTSLPTKTSPATPDPAISFPAEPALPDSIGRVVFYGMTNFVFHLNPDQPTSLMDAIDRLNLGPTADLKHVTVVRDHGGTVRTLDAGNRSDDLRLMDGDRVKIPEKRILF